MTCDDLRDRLATLPDPRRVPANLRPHLAGCPGCRAFAAAVARVEGAVARLPVPAGSPGVKAAFLQRVTVGAGEPAAVITRVPVVRRGGLGDKLADVLARVTARHAAGLAAGVLAAAGVVWWATAERPAVPVAKAPRHKLLQQEVGHLVQLAKVTAPADRLAVWSAVTADVRTEAADVYLIASDDDMKALNRMFTKAVNDGLVAQARKLDPGADRGRLLTEATAALTAVGADVERLSAHAPQQSKRSLEQMARTAQDGRKELERLARGEGV